MSAHLWAMDCGSWDCNSTAEKPLTTSVPPGGVPAISTSGLPMPLGLILRVPVEFKEGAPRVAGVKLHALKAVNILLPGNPDAECLRLGPAGLLRFTAVALGR